MIVIRLVMILFWNHMLGLGTLQTAAPAGLPVPVSGGNPFAGYITHHVPGSKINGSACISTKVSFSCNPVGNRQMYCWQMLHMMMAREHMSQQTHSS